jgi:hypothetical protein
MIVLDSLLVGGLRFVLDKVAQAVDAELDNPERLREELLAAQLRLELGEIDETELAGLEADVLARLRALQGAAGPAGPLSFGDGGVDVDVDVDFTGEE